MDNFLVVRQDKESGEYVATYTIPEAMGRLVPSFYQDPVLVEQSLRNDELVQTPYSCYFALNGQHDRRVRH
jgi:hypothetical protein